MEIITPDKMTLEEKIEKILVLKRQLKDMSEQIQLIADVKNKLWRDVFDELPKLTFKVEIKGKTYIITKRLEPMGETLFINGEPL